MVKLFFLKPIIVYRNPSIPKVQQIATQYMFQNLNLVCHNHRKQLGQGYTGYTMLYTGYEIFTMELIMYIILGPDYVAVPVTTEYV